jgi:TrpR family trp operon transcriptional repressor
MQERLLSKLSNLILKTRNRDELEILLEGLLTPQEIEEVVLRWELMARLLRGETQRDIGQSLGISLGKIARGSRLLKYGSQQFPKLMERLLEETREQTP